MPNHKDVSATQEALASLGSPDLAIVGDRLSLHPPGASGWTEDGNTKPVEASADKPLLESYARFRSAPLEAIRELSAQFLGNSWRTYDKVVGQPVFYRGYSDNMKEMVLASPILRAKVTDLAARRAQLEAEQNLSNDHEIQRRTKELETQLHEVAAQWTDQMICKMESKTFIRGAYYLATQLLTRIYHQGIHVNSEEVLHLRKVAEEAAKKRQSIIFLPSHRSHVDYVSLQLIAFRIGLTLPIVVAGDNLNFPVVGPFLQHAGAMWIRRSFADDALYATLVQAYMDTLLQNGYNVECFVEGGRSRTGKLLQPKFGILSFFLDSLLSGRVDDAIVVPVSTQYDKVIEVNSYISELLGQPKEKESLAAFLSASSILGLKLGRVDCRFYKPWSLRQLLVEETNRHMPSSQVQTSYDTALKRRLLNVFGYKVLANINDASVVMPTALVGTVLLTLRGRGVGRLELIRRVDWLSDKVKSRNGRVLHFGKQSTADVVDRALEVLGPKMIGTSAEVAEPTFYAIDRFQLSFYRNMTIHLFISEALVCTTLYTKVKQDRHHSMPYTEMYEYIYFFSQLFRGEFIFPTTSLDDNLTSTLLRLEADQILTLHRSSSQPDKIESVSLSDTERALGRENFDFYCFLLWPFIEASWLGVVSLLMLLAPTNRPKNTIIPSIQSDDPQRVAGPVSPWLPVRAVQAAAQTLGKTLFAQGDLSYFEAVSRESLARGYARSEEEGIIELSRLKDGGKRKNNTTVCVRLAPEWLQPVSRPPSDNSASAVTRPLGSRTTADQSADAQILTSRLWDLIERIGAARSEGKSRRDGEIETRRVLALVRLVGANLWASEAAASEPSVAAVPGTPVTGAGLLTDPSASASTEVAVPAAGAGVNAGVAEPGKVKTKAQRRKLVTPKSKL